jgi:hypothetical protein
MRSGRGECRGDARAAPVFPSSSPHLASDAQGRSPRISSSMGRTMYSQSASYEALPKLIDVEAHRACAPMTLIRPKIRPPMTVSDGPWARSMLSIAQDHRVTRSVSSSAGCRPASVSRGKRFSISASNLRLTGGAFLQSISRIGADRYGLLILADLGSIGWTMRD